MSEWRKARRSKANGDCIEVADLINAGIMVRDSKDPAGPVLTLTPEEWRRLLAAIKAR